MVKNPPANAKDVKDLGDIRDMGLISGLGRSPGGGHGNSVQYSCLENSQGQRSLEDCSPCCCKESDTTKHLSIYSYGASLVAQRLKHLPPIWETQVQSLGREDPLEKEMITHSIYSYM